MTNFTVKTCGDYKLSPVTTSINGYTPVSIVTDGFLVSGAAKNEITLTGSNVTGTFNVLVQVTDPVGYFISPDPTRYYVTPLYFYV